MRRLRGQVALEAEVRLGQQPSVQHGPVIEKPRLASVPALPVPLQTGPPFGSDVRSARLSQATASHDSPMPPKHRIPTHPGKILLEEFLAPMGITQVELANHLGVSIQRINEIVRGKRGVSPETAWLFAQSLGTTPEFWTNLQVQHDLARTKPARGIRRLKRSA